ncbi:S-layer protein domain-containing protein [Methanolobus sp. ZRKC3]|uniref:hypothetical protein n=1 Tax=Methanolobus sp. ZRKC3 TaxID=3125786 RepID=UPI00324C8EEB
MNQFNLIALILISILFIQCTASAAQSEALINGTGIFVATGEKWDFYQGYAIIVKSVNQESGQAWIKLSLNDNVIQESILAEGETLTYSREYQILNLTVDTIYSSPGGELVTFKPVYQYIDMELPEPVFEEDNSSHINESEGMEQNDNTGNTTIAGFEIIWASLAALSAALYARKK